MWLSCREYEIPIGEYRTKLHTPMKGVVISMMKKLKYNTPQVLMMIFAGEDMITTSVDDEAYVDEILWDLNYSS